MGRIGCWLTMLILAGLALGGCSLRDREAPTALSAFDALAQHIPADAANVLFFDFKPEGQTGQHWTAIRNHLEQNPATQTELHDLLAPFQVEALGLETIVEGPAACAQWGDATVVLFPVVDQARAWDVMIRNLQDANTWGQETVQGKLVYHGQFWQTGRITDLAWTMDDGLMFLIHRSIGQSVNRLRDLLKLAPGASLASLDSWQILRQRLPESPLAVWFGPAGRQSVALAATPYETGLRLDIQWLLGPDVGSMPELQALLALPPVDATAWHSLPANTALAILGHDAYVLWPWFNTVLGLELGPGNPFDAAGSLDLETDLLGEAAPLRGAFALAVTPPLPDQPVFQRSAALQVLLVGKDVEQSQVERLATVMEERGGALEAGEVGGIKVYTQPGNQPGGYAVTFGLQSGTMYVGTSPEIVGQSVLAGRDGSGLAATGAYQFVSSQMPKEPLAVAYLNSQPVLQLLQANAAGEESDLGIVGQFLAAFEGVGVGLRLDPAQASDGEPARLVGVVYFLVSR
jgi:hypothetical protein